MADEALNAIFDSVKTAAQNQPPAAGVAPPQPPQESPELANVLQGVKERGQGLPAKPEVGTPTLTEDSVYQSMQEKRTAHREGMDTIAYVNSNMADRAMDAFGNAIAGGVHDFLFNSGNTPLPQSIKNALPVNGENEWLNSINRAVLRPIAGLANNLDALAFKVFAPASIPFNAVTEAAGTVSALKPLAVTLNDPAMLMIMHQSASPHEFVTKPPLLPEVSRAVDNGIIIPSTPEIKNEAAAAQQTAYMEKQRGLVTQEPLPPTIGQLTSKAAPDVAATTQGITTKQDTLRRGIENITAERAQEAESKSPYLTQLQQAQENAQAKATPKNLARVQDLAEKHEAWVNDYIAEETPEKQGLREGIQTLEQQRMDLAEKSSAARRAAEDTHFTQDEHPIPDGEWKKLKDAGKVQTDENGTEYVRAGDYWSEKQRRAEALKAEPEKSAESLPEEKPTPAGKSPEEQHKAITDDISMKAQTAGIGKEQADAGAELQARGIYGFFARMFGTSAEEMYQKYGAQFEKSEKQYKARKGWLTDKLITITNKGDVTTMMHEGAHHFLALMDKFSKMPDAPQALLDEMKVVRGWLKLRDTDDLSDKAANERAHEQFARGFEQYLREGKAPSKDLIPVFAKVKQWFNEIYQSVIKYQRGEFKLTPEARAFFDRTLTENPEPQIAAGEQPASASVHEAEVKSTPPLEAEAKADTVASDMFKTAERDKEIADAIESTKITTGTETPTGNADTGRTAEPTAGAPNVVEKPIEIAAGGNRPAEEGGTERGGTSPVPPAIPGESSIIGKDGKIDTSSVEKVGHQEFLRRYNAELLRREQDGTADKLFSFEDTVKLSDLRNIAEQMNMTVEQLKNIPTDYGTLTERPILRAGAYILMKQLHEEMIVAAKDAIASGRAENMADFLKSYDKRDQLLNAYKTTESLSKEAGVHLVASKIIEAIDVTGAKETGAILYQMEQMERDGKASPNGLTKEDVDKMTQLANMIGKSDNTADVANILKNADKPTIWDKAKNFEVVVLTSGLVTHLSYAFGLLPLNLFKSILDDTFTAIADKAFGALGFETSGERLTQGFRGLLDQWKSAPNTLLGTGTAIREGKSILLPGERLKAGSDLFNNLRKTTAVDPEVVKQAIADNFKEEKFPDLVELRQKLNDAIKEKDVNAAGRLQSKLDVETARKKAILEKHFTVELQLRLKTWGDVASASKDFWLSQAAGFKAMMQDTKSGAVGVPAYSALEFETKSVYGGIHTFQRMSIAAGNFRIECRRAVWEQAKKNGEDLSAKEVDLRTDAMMQSPTQKVLDNNAKTANEWSFMNSNSEYGKTLNSWLKNIDPWGIPLGKFIVPITTVPVNIKIWTMEHVPVLGTARAEFRDNILGRNGAAARNIAVGKTLSGVAAFGLFYMLAQNEMNTPSRSTIKGHEDEDEDAAQPSNSIRIGDHFVNIEPLAGISELAGLAADYYYIRNIALGKDESETLNHAMTNAITNFALREDALVNLGQVVDAVQGRGAGIENFLNNMASSVAIPALISQENQDPYQREAKTLIDKLKSKVQATSETLEPKVNPITGEFLKRREGIIPGTRFYEGTTKADPIAAKLRAINIHPANPKPQINGVDLTPQQGTEYSVVKAHILYNGMQDLMQGAGAEDFNVASTQDKRKMAIQRETHAAQCAKSYMFNKYPDLLKDANDKYEASCAGEDFNYSPEGDAQ